MRMELNMVAHIRERRKDIKESVSFEALGSISKANYAGNLA